MATIGVQASTIRTAVVELGWPAIVEQSLAGGSECLVVEQDETYRRDPSTSPRCPGTTLLGLGYAHLFWERSESAPRGERAGGGRPRCRVCVRAGAPGRTDAVKGCCRARGGGRVWP